MNAKRSLSSLVTDVSLSAVVLFAVACPTLFAHAQSIADADASIDAVFTPVYAIVWKWAVRIVVSVIAIGLIMNAPKLLTMALGAIVTFRANRGSRRLDERINAEREAELAHRES